MSSVTNIPSVYLQGFKELFLLDDDQFSSIVDGLSITSLTSSIRKLANIVTESDPSKNELVKQIFLSVGSLTVFIEKGISIDELINDVYTAFVKDLEENQEEVIGLSTENGKSIFTQRLSTLLKTERLYYAAKANDLMYEYQNTFIQARTITDIRPIFNSNIDEVPKAGMIIHSLHIHYRREQEGEHKDIFLAMDSEDLMTLKELILRAERKENNLKAIFNSSGMINLNE